MLLVLLSAPSLVVLYWTTMSDNPVRRGVARSRELGCFHCHGELGSGGLADAGGRVSRVPGWTGGEWMDFLLSEAELREYILEGRLPGDEEPDESGTQKRGIRMPAYKDVLSGSDLEDLVAAFKVMAEMVLPRKGSAARRGYDISGRWECFACHGPGASGGRHNPGSLTGTIPGWYGSDFRDLVRDRAEFDTWIREGTLPRLQQHPIASRYLRRQRVDMPAYPTLADAELDDLWAYTQWLDQTGGGVQRE